MIGMQRNVRVQEVLVIVNEALRVQFESKRDALDAAGKSTREIWVFHGTGSQDNIDFIITDGFRVPPAGEETNGARYGQGIYAATGPDTPMSIYARGTRQVILCRALPGRECQGRQADAQVDMWRPRSDWVVFADATSLLPVYVVKY